MRQERAGLHATPEPGDSVGSSTNSSNATRAHDEGWSVVLGSKRKIREHKRCSESNNEGKRSTTKSLINRRAH